MSPLRRTPLALFAAVTVCSLPTIGMAAELLALYEFDEADPSSFADTTTNTVPAIVGGVAAAPAGGFENGAATFDGTGTGITVPIDINADPPQDLTIGAWVNTTDLTNQSPWGHDDGGWDRGISTAGFGTTWGLSNGNIYNTTSPVGGGWQFLAVTYRGDQATNVYVDDNRPFTHGGFAGPSNFTNLSVGSLNPGGVVHPLIGSIDNFFVYDGVLTAKQLDSIRTNGASSITTPLDPPAGDRAVAQIWDFESGDLTGWSIVSSPWGDDQVFNSGGQPADKPGDNPNVANSAQGDFFIRTWDGEAGGLGFSDGPTGIIESAPFVLGRDAQFELLVGGGNHPFRGDPDNPDVDMTAVTLERQLAADDWEAIFAASGNGGPGDGNIFRPVHWDAGLHEGETVRLRIYDTHSGGWGHIDVDDIQFSEAVVDLDDPTDTDGDGMGDAWELFYFGNLDEDGTDDFDSDDLTDLEEWQNGSKPNTAQSDSDGLDDVDEVQIYMTDPSDPDTDGDGYDDGFEVANEDSGFDPLVDDSSEDPDEDDLDNAGELANGTDALDDDSDDDMLNDGAEVDGTANPYTGGVLGAAPGDATSPLDADSDDDTISDFAEVDPGNGSVTDPNNADTDGDTFPDAQEIAFGTSPTDAGDFPMVPDGLISVDFQGIPGIFAGPPVLMTGIEPNFGVIADIWNAFDLIGHDGVDVDPSMALVDGNGDATPVVFSVTGTVSSWTNNPGANPITNDYLFVNAGNADVGAAWELSGLLPMSEYTFYPYGGIARDMLLTVDTNGDGSLLDETPTNVDGAGLAFEGVTADANGMIIGRIDPGVSGEANWGGFQLLLTNEVNIVDTDGDGLSDADEDDLGTDRFNPDTDGDGQSDGDEVNFAGTDPTNADSVLKILSIEYALDSDVVLSWTSVPGKTYTIQASLDLETWTNIGTFDAAAAGNVTTEDLDFPAEGETTKNYRVVVGGF